MRLPAVFCLFVSYPSYCVGLSQSGAESVPVPDQGRQLAGKQPQVAFSSFLRSTEPPLSALLPALTTVLASDSECPAGEIQASSTANRTLSQRLRQTGAKPNLAQQRTAPGCHGSCFLRSGVFPSSRISTSLGALSAVHLRSYRASPSRSLSLRSLGVATRSP